MTEVEMLAAVKAHHKGQAHIPVCEACAFGYSTDAERARSFLNTARCAAIYYPENRFVSAQEYLTSTRFQRVRCLHRQFLYDIFGNPFRPITLDPRWLTSSVLDLSRTIYDERVFERMPIIADALMDAGCDSEEIINHCRGPGPHVRGCWVVDLLLGKE